ncbi:MAG: flagellar basal-body rod protein FlgG [Pseudomonadota bacterium]
MRSLSTGAMGMLAQQLNVDVLSNNIANLTTTSFKRSRAEFQDFLYQSYRRVGTTSSDAGTIVPVGVQVGGGVRAAGTYRIHEQGAVKVTENPLDLAINGHGFFQVNLPDGTLGYTRAGSFQISPEGNIVTVDGYTIVGPDALPAGATGITVNEQGTVQATIQGQDAAIELGQFELARFVNDAGLEAIGNNNYIVTAASGDPAIGVPGAEGYGRIRQGMIENSNVNVVEEVTQLITAQRAYEMNSKVISTSDEMLRSIVQLR